MQEEISQLDKILLPLFIWTFAAGFLGLMQVWMQTLKCRRRAIQAGKSLTRAECLLLSLADGNLFIFSISTLGGGFGVLLNLVYKGDHGLDPRYIAILMVPCFLIIIFAAHEWTDSRPTSKEVGRRQSRGQVEIKALKKIADIAGVEAYLHPRDIRNSVYCAWASFAFATVIEMVHN